MPSTYLYKYIQVVIFCRDRRLCEIGRRRGRKASLTAPTATMSLSDESFCRQLGVPAGLLPAYTRSTERSIQGRATVHAGNARQRLPLIPAPRLVGSLGRRSCGEGRALFHHDAIALTGTHNVVYAGLDCQNSFHAFRLQDPCPPKSLRPNRVHTQLDILRGLPPPLTAGGDAPTSNGSG